MTLAEHYLTQVLDVEPTPENLHRLYNEHCPDFHYKKGKYTPCPKTRIPGYSCKNCWEVPFDGHICTDTHHYL